MDEDAAKFEGPRVGEDGAVESATGASMHDILDDTYVEPAGSRPGLKKMHL